MTPPIPCLPQVSQMGFCGLFTACVFVWPCLWYVDQYDIAVSKADSSRRLPSRVLRGCALGPSIVLPPILLRFLPYLPILLRMGKQCFRYQRVETAQNCYHSISSF